MIRLYRFAYSTNVERVALALAHKGLEAESVEVDPADRTPVRELSGQELVPVIEDGGRVVADSMAIVRYLDERFPERPLYPREDPRRSETLVFVDWFDRVWKRPPNQIEAELGAEAPDQDRIRDLSSEMRAALDLFEGMLEGRDHLMGDDFSAADCAAFPFLKYAVQREPADDELFHRLLEEHQPLGDGHPRLREWIERVNARPRA